MKKKGLYGFMGERYITKNLFVILPRLRASPRHGGARRFR
jgi:hypothetical protein